MDQPILVERRDGIATVTFNRPDQRNALNYWMWLDLRRILVDLETDPEVRVVVFRGAGTEAFSAGADIKDFDLYRNNAQKARLYQEAVEGTLRYLERMTRPTIAMIRGYCVGGGFEFTHACDLRIASEDARVGIPAARLGISIRHEEMRRLVQLGGRGSALFILLTARLFDAQTALRMGLLDAVVPPEELEEFTYGVARDIARLAPLSHRIHKEVLRKVLEDPALAHLTPEEADLPLTVFDTEDYREGRRAFLEKRPPRFQGK